MNNIEKEKKRLALVKERVKRNIYVYKHKACDFTIFDEDNKIGFNFVFLSSLFNTDILTDSESYKSRLERGLKLGTCGFLYYSDDDEDEVALYQYDRLSEFEDYKWDKLLCGLYNCAKLSNDSLKSLTPKIFVNFIRKLDKTSKESHLSWMFNKKQ